MKINIPDDVLELMDALQNCGYECYIVGGAIRSYLLNLPIHDYDLTTNATPLQMQEVFRNYKTIETGLQHGTLTVLSNQRPVEITTYRKDTTYQDHRHPDAVEFTSTIQEDCARRDFTINAMCYNKQTGLLDFYHGQQDIKNHLIRCIGDPNKRFDEDALRILRAIRFASRLNFEIEEETSKAIFANKQSLSFVSIERIQEELEGILMSPCCGRYYQEYKDVFSIFLPEVISIRSLPSTYEALNTSSINYIARLSILLKDFPNIPEVLRRMKYSNAIQKEVLTCIKWKDFTFSSKIDLRHFLSFYAFDFHTYIAFRSAIDSTLNKEDILLWYQQIQNNHDCISLKQLAINGNDLKLLGYQGKQIAETLKKLLDAVIEDKVSNNKSNLLSYIKKD